MLVGFYPTVSPLPREGEHKASPLREGMLSVAVVVRPHPDPLLQGEGECVCPDLLFRQATLHHLVDDAESREVPLAIALSAIASDGTPACQFSQNLEGLAVNEPPGNRTLNLQLNLPHPLSRAEQNLILVVVWIIS